MLDGLILVTPAGEEKVGHPLCHLCFLSWLHFFRESHRSKKFVQACSLVSNLVAEHMWVCCVPTRVYLCLTPAQLVPTPFFVCLVLNSLAKQCTQHCVVFLPSLHLTDAFCVCVYKCAPNWRGICLFPKGGLKAMSQTLEKREFWSRVGRNWGFGDLFENQIKSSPNFRTLWTKAWPQRSSICFRDFSRLWCNNRFCMEPSSQWQVIVIQRLPQLTATIARHYAWSSDPGMLQPSQIHSLCQQPEFWSRDCGDCCSSHKCEERSYIPFGRAAVSSNGGH